ncbi:MAG: hypothetical protein Q9227_007911 [Pyrenula ochraceoflavens]
MNPAFNGRYSAAPLANSPSNAHITQSDYRLPQEMEKLAFDFSAYQNQVTAALVATTRAAGQVSATDLSFHRSTSHAVARGVDGQNMRLLRLTNRLLRSVSTQSKVQAPPKLSTMEHVEDRWRGIIDVVDDLLEKADRNLDEFTGIIKSTEPAVKPIKESKLATLKGYNEKFPTIFDLSTVSKPQEKFDTKVDNFDAGPWKPLLTEKPHASLPLSQSVVLGDDGTYVQPYQTEIDQYCYPSFVYEANKPINFMDPEKQSPVFVDTEIGVSQMLEELKHAQEIAIDLEHHDIHSYFGLVSLMQISTREKDWIVDTLQPWRQNLQILNQVFANQHILKVLHGSAMDIIWLQRDLGLYVVGLFDTYHAADALQLPRKGLQYLLESYANFRTSKKYQIADWRMRPLPPNMLEYARADTHYLLYIYDRMRNSLIERSTDGRDLIDRVLQNSKREALQCYTRISYGADAGSGPLSWRSQLLRQPGSRHLNTQQFAVFRALHDWRDFKARSLDEGILNVLHPKALNQIARNMPTTHQSLMQAAIPVSQTIRDSTLELLKLIEKAKQEGENGLTVQQALEEINPPKHQEHFRNPIQSVDVSTSLSPPNEGSASSGTAQAVRALASRLWGEANLQQSTKSTSNSAISHSPLRRLRRALWPAPVENTSSNDTQTSSKRQLSTTSQPSTDIPVVEPPSASITQDENPIFTIRPGKTQSRLSETLDQDTLDLKSSEEEDEGEVDETEALGGGESQVDLSTLTKTQRRRQKRIQRRIKKEAKKSANLPSAEPFDYANAPSILHKSPDAVRQGPKKDDSSKRFSPYEKALNAPSGLKKTRQPAGRSHTFHK